MKDWYELAKEMHDEMGMTLFPIPLACRRCDGYHPRWCDRCEFEPACHDHNCWTVAEIHEEASER